MTKKPRVTRYLKMSEVADLLGVREYSKPHRRAEYVRRLFQRMERRDGETYLRRDGKDWVISPEDVDRARDWTPNTLLGLRGDVDEVGEQVKTLKKRVNSHGRRLSILEEWRRLTAEYIDRISQLR